MPTRRTIVLGTIATGIAVRTGRVLAKASQPATPVNFDVPAGACDCHTHIFGEPEKFPFFAGRACLFGMRWLRKDGDRNLLAC